MKIVIVGTAYPLRGGISHYNALLYRELGRAHEVQIITFSRQYPSLLFPGRTQQESEGELLRVPSEQLVDSVNPFNWYAVGENIRRRTPDLLIFKYWLPFFGPCFGTIARRAKRNGRTRVVYICDNVVPHERRPGDRLFTRYAFGPADAFIVQSDAVERDLLAFQPGAVYRKVPHPVYDIFGRTLDRQDARRELGIGAGRVMLFFGYVRAYKGLDVLLDAMAEVRLRMDVQLLVVGEFYDDEQKYREQIARLGLGDHVRVVADYVPNDRVGVYFSAADAVILPYLSATQSGIAQIAYNFDRPVIATRVGGLGEVVVDGKTGLLVPPADPHALAAAIIRFYEENRADAFTAAVREEKRKYTWEAMVHALEELGRT
jgi:glycosyltransferase involved in cell wall biosynthesis